MSNKRLITAFISQKKKKSSTFFVLTCTVAEGDAAQNHSDSARNVCQKKAAQISLVEVLQLEDILWNDPPASF